MGYDGMEHSEEIPISKSRFEGCVMGGFLIHFLVVALSSLIIVSAENGTRTEYCVGSQRIAKKVERGTWSDSYYNQKGECNQLMEEFSYQVSHFVRCSVRCARPFAVCEQCLEYFINVTISYEQIMTKADNDSTTCEDRLLNSDKIQVVRLWNTAAQNLWSESQCSACFTESLDAEGHMIYTLSNDTLKFDQYLNNTLDCIGNATNGTFSHPAFVACNSSSVCRKCAVQYKQLNKFYNSLADSADNLCMDIVDKMNASRILWSEHLLCVHHTNPVITFFISSVVVMLLPLLFYFLAWWRSVRQEQRIVPRKRHVPLSSSNVSSECQ